MRRLSETVLIIDLSIVTYRQQLYKAKSQNWGVFRDWYVGLKSLSDKGLLHMGVVKAPWCNFILWGADEGMHGQFIRNGQVPHPYLAGCGIWPDGPS
jgi:hypothetical protein